MAWFHERNYKQIFFYCTIFYVLIGIGAGIGFNTIFVHQCSSLNGVNLTLNQISWISSIFPLMEMFGSFAAGWISEIWGRKITIQIFSLLNTAGWIIIYVGNDIQGILIGRVLSGLCGGFLLATCNCFLADVTVKQHKELVLSVVLFWHSCGSALANIFGTITDWRTTALICAAIPLVNEVLFVFIPESYILLLNKKKYNVAKQSFLWFRGQAKTAEFEELLYSLPHSGNLEKLNFINLTKMIAKKDFLKPLGIVLIFLATLQSSGYLVLAYYALTVFEKTVTGLNEYVSMLIMDLIKSLTLGLGPLITMHFPLRKTAIISGIVSNVALFAFSLSTYLADVYPKNTFLKYAPMIPLLIYLSFLCAGLLPLKFVIPGIMFPSNIKGLGNGIACGTNFMLFFVVVKTSPALLAYLGHSMTFFMYGCLMFCGMFFVYFTLPETKGKICLETEERGCGKAPENNEEEGMLSTDRIKC